MKLLHTIKIAEKAGINTLAQLRVFLEVARAAPTDLYTLSGTKSIHDQKHKQYRAVVTRLSDGFYYKNGEPFRGLRLVTKVSGAIPSPKSPSRTRDAIILTPKGKRLAEKFGVVTR